MSTSVLLITGPAKDIGMVPLVKSALIKAGYTVTEILDGPYLTDRACKLGMPSVDRDRLESFIVGPQDVTIFDVSKPDVSLSELGKNLIVVCDRMSVENDLHLPRDCPMYYLPELETDVLALKKAIAYCEQGKRT